jgi:hypothetical protein
MLDGSVNRSIGARVQHQLKKLPDGSKIDNIIVKNNM